MLRRNVRLVIFIWFSLIATPLTLNSTLNHISIFRFYICQLFWLRFWLLTLFWFTSRHYIFSLTFNFDLLLFQVQKIFIRGLLWSQHSNLYWFNYWIRIYLFNTWLWLIIITIIYWVIIIWFIIQFYIFRLTFIYKRHWFCFV